MKALSGEKMSQSSIDFLLILIVIKILYCSSWNQWRLVCSGISWVRSLTPQSPDPAHPWLLTPDPTTLPPLPMDNMHGNLRFYYVQQPCLDYVLFLGFFEVTSFCFSDISCSDPTVSIRRPFGWDVWPLRSCTESTQTCIPLPSHLVFPTRPGRRGFFHYG